MIYTIGYGAPDFGPSDLKRITFGLDAVLIDCRAKSGRCKRGFGRRQLEELLGERFEWRGDRLGGFGHITPAGLNELARDHAAGRRLLLMCAEEAPGECHRHDGICWPHFPDAVHIFQDELVTAAALQRAIEAEDRGHDAPYDIHGRLSALLVA